jgi:preprotein translocase subunit SecD
MNRRYVNLSIIIVLLGIAIYTVLPSTTNLLGKPIKTVLGLDLQGGMQIIMQVDPNFVGQFSQEQLETARQIMESRSNGLGVSEVTFQTSGTRYIIGELPGVTKSEQIIDVIKQTGQLEFVNFGNTPFEAGTIVNTTLGNAPEGAINDQVYETVMTGSDLTEASVGRTQLGEYEVQFTLTDNGQKIFSQYTAQNVGTYLGIVLDKKVISAPVIKTAITDKSGVISGGFTYDSANALAVQLRYGSLPLPLVVEQIRVIGPILGQDSLD